MNKVQNFFKFVTWKSIKKQKYGWLTTLFYGIGAVFGGFATAFLRLSNFSVQGADPTKTMKFAFINITGGLWVTLAREFFYLIFFGIFYGIKNPKIFLKIKYTFSKGGRVMLGSVFANYMGNIAAIVGVIILLGNVSLSSSFETSFIVFTFIVTAFTFKQKFNWKTLVGVVSIMAFMLGIFGVNYYNISNSETDSQQGLLSIVGLLLMFLANIGYLIKNVCTEYVYKNRLLDTETTQLFATFYSFFIGLLITPIMLFIFQPLLTGGGINFDPWRQFSHTLFSNYSGVLILGLVAAMFLLTGRNCQYANTMISGASISNIFYQGKLIVTTVLSVIIYAIWSAFGGGSIWPYTNSDGHAETFSGLMKIFNLDNPLYWILIFLLFGAIVYTVLSGQKKFESSTHEYRKTRNIKVNEQFKDKIELKMYEDKTLDQHHEETNKNFPDDKKKLQTTKKEE